MRLGWSSEQQGSLGALPLQWPFGPRDIGLVQEVPVIQSVDAGDGNGSLLPLSLKRLTQAEAQKGDEDQLPTLSGAQEVNEPDGWLALYHLVPSVRCGARHLLM